MDVEYSPQHLYLWTRGVFSCIRHSFNDPNLLVQKMLKPRLNELTNLSEVYTGGTPSWNIR